MMRLKSVKKVVIHHRLIFIQKTFMKLIFQLIFHAVFHVKSDLVLHGKCYYLKKNSPDGINSDMITDSR